VLFAGLALDYLLAEAARHLQAHVIPQLIRGRSQVQAALEDRVQPHMLARVQEALNHVGASLM
jgi:hypothetical protein